MIVGHVDINTNLLNIRGLHRFVSGTSFCDHEMRMIAMKIELRRVRFVNLRRRLLHGMDTIWLFWVLLQLKSFRQGESLLINASLQLMAGRFHSFYLNWISIIGTIMLVGVRLSYITVF